MSFCSVFGLRARLVLPLLAIGISLAASMALLILRTNAGFLRGNLAARAGAITNAVSHFAETTSDEVALQRFVAKMAAEEDVRLIMVAAGEPLVVVASSRPEWLGLETAELPERTSCTKMSDASLPRGNELEHFADGTIDYTVSVQSRLRANSPLLTSPTEVHLRLDGRPVMQQQALITRSAVAMLVLAVGLAALAKVWLLRRVVLQPMKKIAEIAHLVASGERMARIQSKRRDELGALANNIDLMIDELVRRETLEANSKQEALAAKKRQESALAELACSNFALDQHAIVAVTDLSGTITYVNNKFCEISQYTREELVGQNHRIVNSGYHPKSFWVDMWRSVMRGRVWRSEVCNRAKDGSIYWVDTTIVPYADRDGRVTKLVSIRSDITAHKQAQVQLQEGRERFDLAVRGSSDGIWDWTIATGNVYYSPRFKELLGYAADEFPDDIDSFISHLHPEDLVSTWEAARRHLDADQLYDINYRLRTKNGEWRWFRSRGAASRDAKGVAIRMAGSISDITDLKEAEEQLAWDARIDNLTGLPNRTLLLERLQLAVERAQLSSNAYAVLFLDFDRFKLINDSLGHEAGDELLRQIAVRLSTHVNSDNSISRTTLGHTCARLGGDEFVVLLQNLSSRDDALVAVERLSRALSAPYQLHSQEVYSTASIGIVMGPSAYRRAEDILRDADTAMYEAKHAGKACHVIFDDAMRQRVTRRQQLESDLHRAIESNTLELAYQPIVDIVEGSVQALEVLCRWRHPVYGAIGPGEFVPIAEESGIIDELGEWVLRSACRQYAEWRDESDSPTLPMLNLNLSRKQFGQPNLAELVRSILDEFSIDPALIELEVTEDAFCDDLPAATRILESLKELGVKLAIDDFGVGSSSFAALHRFPVDTLKIDRSIVVDLANSQDALALIQGLVVIANGLDVALVIEGVEDQEQLAILRELGCTLAQGYHFSRPMPAESVATYLRATPPIVAITDGTYSATTSCLTAER